METKELNNLMIDDLVFYDGKQIKVENVHRDCINFEPDIPYVQEEFWINLSEIKPIPLTEEILKENFKLSDYDRYYVGKDLYVKCYDNDTFGFGNMNDAYNEPQFESFAKVNSVHQLQHALRLVGLDELADNLKV